MGQSTDSPTNEGALTDFLKQAFDRSDDETVVIEMQVTLGALRRHRAFFESYSIRHCKPLTEQVTRRSKLPKEHPTTKSRKGKHLILKKDVLEALRKNQNTAISIADFLGTDSAQVRKSLSRYVKEGLIVRTGHGKYALK